MTFCYTLSHPLTWVFCRCSLAEVGLEMDRILRPGGMVVVRDTEEMIHRISKIATALHWTFEVANMEPEGVYHLVARKHFRKQKSYLQIVEFQKFKRGATKLVSWKWVRAFLGFLWHVFGRESVLDMMGKNIWPIKFDTILMSIVTVQTSFPINFFFKNLDKT